MRHERIRAPSARTVGCFGHRSPRVAQAPPDEAAPSPAPGTRGKRTLPAQIRQSAIGLGAASEVTELVAGGDAELREHPVQVVADGAG